MKFPEFPALGFFYVQILPDREKSVLIGKNREKFVLNCPKLEPVVFGRCSFAENLLTNQNFKKMDRIFKNDLIMGLVAIATLVLVALPYIKKEKAESVN